MYQDNIQRVQKTLDKLHTKKNFLSICRIILLLTSVYLFYLMVYQKNEIMGLWAFLVLILFVFTVNRYLNLLTQLKYYKALKNINEEELAFLEGKHQFENGVAFLNPQHAFSYDLDLFGKGSIFEFINRTGTSLGKQRLAFDLQEIPDETTIKLKQEAVKELSNNLSFRQQFQTLARLVNTTEQEDAAIKKWAETISDVPAKSIRIAAVLVPLLFFFSLIATIFDLHPLAIRLTTLFFTINLMLSGMMMKFISAEIGKSDKISHSLQQYSQMIQLFESESFQSEELKRMQKSLEVNNKMATQIVRRLATLFEKLNTVANLFVFILFNGTFQYHFWVHKKLIKWKNDNQQYLWQWIEVIGKVESLNSIANFAYNNPEYQYANVTSKDLIFADLGHPLIDKRKRIRNDIDFTKQSFFILTGSNMSGKSTFLRAVGINLVLSYVGAPIDVTKASVCPLPIWVSMRLTDSLSESESYFFAEVKRLKEIVTQANKQPVFVLLDEILKGTNSDDKKSGTVGVIKKLHEFGVKGIIATHDLEVCEISKNYPEVMANKRFEVEIINDELHFDYRLKDGICQNKNATFIMKKMNII